MDTLTEARNTADEDLLVAWPGTLTDSRRWYPRVSTGSQPLHRQLDVLTIWRRCRRIFTDKRSGNNGRCPELLTCLAFFLEGPASADFAQRLPYSTRS